MQKGDRPRAGVQKKKFVGRRHVKYLPIAVRVLVPIVGGIHRDINNSELWKILEVRRRQSITVRKATVATCDPQPGRIWQA
jgi:hypothetical protein